MKQQFRAAVTAAALALPGACSIDAATSGPLYSPLVTTSLTATANDVRLDGRLVTVRPIDAAEDGDWAVWLQEVQVACGGEAPEALAVRSVSMALDSAESTGVGVLEEIFGDATVTVFVESDDGARANLATRGRVRGVGPVVLDVVGDAAALDPVVGAMLGSRFHFGLDARREGSGAFTMALKLRISAQAICKLPAPDEADASL